MDYHGYTVYANGDIMGKRGWMLKPGMNHKGYLQVCMMINKEKKNIRVHRLVALCYIPNPDNKPEVDHIKCEEITNNNVSNLRWATKSEQMINQSIRCTNTSGVKGVSKFKNGWRASITINGKRLQGYYKSFDKAVAKRQEWELEFHCF